MVFNIPFLCSGQKTIDDLLNLYNVRSVPYITVQELKMNINNYTILDTRRKEEYEVSHIPGAIWAGEDPNKKQLDFLVEDNSRPIVVYCSIGVRSEKYGEELLAWGYKDVSNLYGSIFFWKDAGYSVIDKNGRETEKVHVFKKVWGKYLSTGQKVY